MSESKDQNHITAWRNHWDAFDKNKDGKVDYFEVRGLIKSLYKPSSKEIDEVFAVFDKDGNQKISFDEFVSALTTVQAVKLDPVITTRPEFKDKKIATQQRTTVLDISKEAKEELKKQFDALDKDKDGSISRSEAAKLAQDRHEPPARVVNDVMRYLDKNRDGSVTFEEFSAAMEKCQGDIMTLLTRAELPRITIEKDDLQRFLKNFKRLDSNNDGHLDSYEVRQLLKSLYAPSEEEINKIFDRFDKNKDGRITFNEFEDALTTIDVVATDAKISTKVGDKKVATAQQATKIKLTDQMREQLKQQFESIDVNKSGFIDRVEARRLAQDSYVPPSAAIDKVIAHMDINQDKTVSMEEFIAALQKAQGYLPELVKVSLDPKAAQAGAGADKKDDKKKA